MNFVYIEASDVLRKDADDTTAWEGFEMVHDGAIQITGSGLLSIFERDNLTMPVLRIDLHNYRIRVFKTHSAFNNHVGATMTITGWFDRHKREVISIKMNRDDRHVISAVLCRLNL